jgi:hypothetical protein
MCEQCEIFEKQIAQYKRFLTNRFDPLTEERMKAALAELENRKAEFKCPLVRTDKVSPPQLAASLCLGRYKASCTGSFP